MSQQIFRMVVLLGVAGLAGCAAPPRQNGGGMPSPEITDAVRTAGHSDIILITGDYFKMKSDDKNDVVVSLNGRNWMPVSKIIDSSESRYSVTLPYGPAFPQVWVRVYGMNETYSDPYLVHTAR